MTATPTQTALLKLMTLMSAADGTMRDAELSVISTLAGSLPVFRGIEIDDVVSIVDETKAQLADADDIDAILAEITRDLPRKAHPTAYALAVEVAAADARVRIEELSLLEMIRNFIKIDAVARAAIEESARVRYWKGEAADA